LEVGGIFTFQGSQPYIKQFYGNALLFFLPSLTGLPGFRGQEIL
jgi:hypothetical protein